MAGEAVAQASAGLIASRNRSGPPAAALPGSSGFLDVSLLYPDHDHIKRNHGGYLSHRNIEIARILAKHTLI